MAHSGSLIYPSTWLAPPFCSIYRSGSLIILALSNDLTNSRPACSISYCGSLWQPALSRLLAHSFLVLYHALWLTPLLVLYLASWITHRACSIPRHGSLRSPCSICGDDSPLVATLSQAVGSLRRHASIIRHDSLFGSLTLGFCSIPATGSGFSLYFQT